MFAVAVLHSESSLKASFALPPILFYYLLACPPACLLVCPSGCPQVAERGLVFARSFGSLLAEQQRGGSMPPQLREAWSFAAHLSLAAATSKRAEEKRKADALGRGGGR